MINQYNNNKILVCYNIIITLIIAYTFEKIYFIKYNKIYYVNIFTIYFYMYITSQEILYILC